MRTHTTVLDGSLSGVDVPAREPSAARIAAMKRVNQMAAKSVPDLRKTSGGRASGNVDAPTLPHASSRSCAPGPSDAIAALIEFLQAIPRTVSVRLSLDVACNSSAVCEAGRLLGVRLERQRAGGVEIIRGSDHVDHV